MRQFPHLKRNHRSGNLVYFRRYPTALQPIIGRTFFERSLRTNDRRAVPAAWAAANGEYEAIIRDAMNGRPGPAEPTGQHPQSGTPDNSGKWYHIHAVNMPANVDVALTKNTLNLQIDEVSRAIAKWGESERYDRAQRVLNDPSYIADEISFIDECKLVGACGHHKNWTLVCPPLYHLSNKIIKSEGIAIPPLHSSLYIVERLVEQELRHVLEDEGRWRNHDFSGMLSSPPRSVEPKNLAPNGKSYITLETLVEYYISATRKPIKTASKLRLIARYINGSSREPINIDKVTKSFLLVLQVDALKLPARLNSSEKNLTFPDLVAAAPYYEASRKRLTPQAVRSWFNLLGGCFSWAVRADYIEKIPQLASSPL